MNVTIESFLAFSIIIMSATLCLCCEGLRRCCWCICSCFKSCLYSCWRCIRWCCTRIWACFIEEWESPSTQSDSDSQEPLLGDTCVRCQVCRKVIPGITKDSLPDPNISPKCKSCAIQTRKVEYEHRCKLCKRIFFTNTEHPNPNLGEDFKEPMCPECLGQNASEGHAHYAQWNTD